MVLALPFPAVSVWENVDYNRVIDISRSYVKENHQIQIRNILSEPVQLYYFVVPLDEADSISVFLPSTGKPQQQRMALVSEPLEEQFEELKFFKIQLPFPIAPKATFDLQISLIMTDAILPVPAVVLEMDSLQSLLYNTRKLPLSVYPTLQYTLKFLGFQSTVDEVPVDSVSEELRLEYEGHPEHDKLVYGPYDLSKLEPMVNMPMALLYKRLAPLIHVTNLTRGIWVSHWSELVQVNEDYQMTNNGAKLKNGFSRVDYMKKKLASKMNPAINSIEIPILDPETSDIYFTDLVGNVSTSMIYENSLILKPRFPVLGGWNYNFTIGWNNKIENYVHHSDDEKYILRVPILSGPRDCSYDKLNFDVYLPSGLEVISVESPIDYDNYQVDEFYSYLDTLKGHTRLHLEFENLVDEMRNVQLIVEYKYSTVDKLSKIVYISLYIFIAFISFIGIKLIDIRIDVNQGKKEKKH